VKNVRDELEAGLGNKLLNGVMKVVCSPNSDVREIQLDCGSGKVEGR